MMPAKRVTIPVGHRPAMPVPIGGAMCSNCKFYSEQGGRFGSCAEPNFKAYYSTTLIPCPPNEFCSDWYEPALPVRRC